MYMCVCVCVMCDMYIFLIYFKVMWDYNHTEQRDRCDDRCDSNPWNVSLCQCCPLALDGWQFPSSKSGRSRSKCQSETSSCAPSSEGSMTKNIHKSQSVASKESLESRGFKMFKICSRLKPWHILHRLAKAPRPFAYVLPSSKVLKLSSEEGLGEEKSGEPIIGRMSIFHPENARWKSVIWMGKHGKTNSEIRIYLHFPPKSQRRSEKLPIDFSSFPI